MIHFRDRAFCSARCTTADCSRRWTRELQNAADAWWTWVDPDHAADDGPPVSFMNFGPMCPEYRQPVEAAEAGEDHRVLEPGETNP